MHRPNAALLAATFVFVDGRITWAICWEGVGSIELPFILTCAANYRYYVMAVATSQDMILLSPGRIRMRSCKV